MKIKPYTLSMLLTSVTLALGLLLTASACNRGTDTRGDSRKEVPQPTPESPPRAAITNSGGQQGLTRRNNQLDDEPGASAGGSRTSRGPTVKAAPVSIFPFEDEPGEALPGYERCEPVMQGAVIQRLICTAGTPLLGLDGKATGKVAAPGEIFHVYKPRAPLPNGFVLVGRRYPGAEGVADGRAWHPFRTPQGVVLKDTGAAIAAFAAADDAAAAARGAAVRPVLLLPPGRKPFIAADPLVEAKLLGTKWYYRVSALTGPNDSSRAVADVLDELGTVELAILIDGTRSMTCVIDRAKEQVIGALEAMRAAHVRLKVTLLVYRDFNIKDVEPFVTVVGPDFSGDLTRVAAAIRGIKAITVSSNDEPEIPNAAVVRAVKTMNWSRHALKCILVVGDAPGRLRGTEEDPTLEHTVHAAKGWRIAASWVPGVATSESAAEAKRQFSFLASETGGLFFELDRPEKIADHVSRLVTDSEAQNRGMITSLLAGGASGNQRPTAAGERATARNAWLSPSYRLTEEEQVAIASASCRAELPGGWAHQLVWLAADGPDGKPVATVAELVGAGELRSILNNLDQLRQWAGTAVANPGEGATQAARQAALVQTDRLLDGDLGLPVAGGLLRGTYAATIDDPATWVEYLTRVRDNLAPLQDPAAPWFCVGGIRYIWVPKSAWCEDFLAQRLSKGGRRDDTH